MKIMINNIQYYTWGSKDIFTKMYYINNPSNKPMAELWIGANHRISSQIIDNNGKKKSLNLMIANNPIHMLGSAVAARFGKLPFLFKVLCIEKPLSVQVHPRMEIAKKGFIKENLARISLDAFNRNYKDKNHKPELIFSLTKFQAMNGFRKLEDIIYFLKPVAHAHPVILNFLKYPDIKHLAQLFQELLTMQGDQKSSALIILKNVLNHNFSEPWKTIKMISNNYPDDNVLFFPLLLNLITLKPGQAMFVPTETPHSYLKGVALEVMADSDNVLRAGLTSKYINIPELINNTKFITKSSKELLVISQKNNNTTTFPVPVDDFIFSIHKLNIERKILVQHSATILFCINGVANIINANQSLMLKSGESVFIEANEFPIIINGHGRLVNIYNEI